MADFLLSSTQTINRYRLSSLYIDVSNQTIYFNIDLGSGTGDNFTILKTFNGTISGADWNTYIGVAANAAKTIGANVHDAIRQFCINKNIV